MLLRLAPLLALGLMLGPILFGLAGSLAPAFGWLPVLGGSEFSLAPFKTLLTTPGLGASIWLSLASGLVTTFLALLMVMALVSAWSGTRFFRFVQHLVSPLLSIPHAATAFGFAFLFAPSGWLVRFISPDLTGWTRPPDWIFPHDPAGLALIAGLTAKELPFLLLVTLAALPQLDAQRQVRVARTLGYGPMASWIYGVWPRLYAQIRLPVFAVIAYASSVVDVALILGPTNPPPLAVQLLRWMADPDLEMRFLASSGAILQLLVTLFALALWWCGEKITAFLFRRSVTSGFRFRRDGWLRITSGSVVLATILSLIIGLLGLLVWSFAGFWRFPESLPRIFTTKTWMKQAAQLAEPALHSVAIGLLAAFIALIITLLCLEQENRSQRPAGEGSLALIYLPLIVPQVAFLFGLQLLFLLVGWENSFGGVLFSHLVFVLPYVFLSLGDPWRAFDPRYAQLAASLGAGPWKIFFSLRLPILLRPILTAAAVGFAVSIGQYLATLLIGGGRWETITTEAVALSSGGNRRVIGIYALVQMALPFIGFTLALAIPAFLHRDRRDLQPARHD
ncbi:MAG: ABC transporter permease subunit [Cohaesibacter sp.]|nr:ABC transporter permease subunit [Cohaesibacter sp.]